MRFSFKSAVLLAIAMLPLMAFAQQTTITTQVQLPSPRFLSDFPSKVTAIINSGVTMDVNLQIAIKGDNGVLIRTNPSFQPFSIVLTTGATVILGSMELQDYFLPQNMLFSGITEQQMANQGLPPGNYRLCIRVFTPDGNTLTGDDPMGCSGMFFILASDPPILTNPVCGSNVNLLLNLGMNFSWTPSPGAGPFTTYTIRMVEFPQENMNPATVMSSATTPYFFEKEIQGFSYFYNPADPPLQPGKSYAWTVTAKDAEGGTWFKNNGQSEVCRFKAVSETFNVVQTGPITTTPPPIINVQFLMPFSTVNGTLLYAYNSSSGGTVTLGGSPGQFSGGAGTFYGNAAGTPWAGSTTPSFSYNSGLSSAGAKPLANMKISLVKKYVIRKGYYLYKPVEDYVLNDYGYLQQTQFNATFPNSGQVMATTTTDANGNFSFFFLSADSIGKVLENFVHGQPKENNDFFEGTIYSTYRIVVESPYYCSPENDIIVQPWETKSAGDVVSLAKDYNLKIHVKSQKTSIQQIGGGGNELNDVEVSVIRKGMQPGTPPDEGQGLNKTHPSEAGNMISQGKTGQDGSVFFNRLVRHREEWNPDRYTIYCSTNKLKGNYNYADRSTRYHPVFQTSLPGFPFTGPANVITWNSQYKLETKDFEIEMWPDQPRVFGRVVNNQGNPLPGIKVVILSVYTHPENYKPEKLFRTVTTNQDGYFEFNNLDTEISGDFPNLIVDGPKRTIMVKPAGYKFFEKQLGVLLLGQQTDMKTIALEPDGKVSGKVEDEDGNAVSATVAFNDQTSVTTKLLFTINPFKIFSYFSAQVPSGNNVKVKVIPDNPEYATLEKTVKINVSSGGATQDLGTFTVMRSRHRIRFWVREKTNDKPVKGVSVKVKNSDIPAVLSDDKGEVNLRFSAPGTQFYLEVTPPENMDLMPADISLYNANSIEPKIYGALLLEPAVKISGTVTYGNDKKPLAGADVFLEQGTGGTTTLVKTGADGKYTLGKIPLSPSQATITAGKTEPGITIIAQSKTVNITQTKIVDFHLPVFDKMSITEIYGFPVMVDSLKDEGASAVISGRFKNMPDNENFKINTSNFMMEFENVKMVKLSQTTPQGVPLTKPEQNQVVTGVQQMPLKVHDQFYATHTPPDDYFVVRPDKNGDGYLEGYASVLNTSFQVSEAVMSFEKEGLYLGESGSGKALVTSITAKPSAKRSFTVTDRKAGSVEFSLMGFDATGTGTLNGASIKMQTSITAGGIPLMNPAKLQLNAGEVTYHKTGFDPINVSSGVNFKLEKWEVGAGGWSLTKSANKIFTTGGKVTTGIADVPFKAMSITHNNIELNGIEFGAMSLAGVTPLEMLTTNVHLLYDPSTGSDLKPHWRLAAIGLGGQPAARIKGLPGMNPGAVINFQVFEALSNNENQVSFGNQNQQVAFYNVYKMTPVSLNNYQGYFQLSGLVDLGIPRVSNNFTGILQFSKNAGQVLMEVKNLAINFEAPGKVKYFNASQAGTQKLDPSGFEAKGRIKDAEGVELLTTLYRKQTEIYVKVEPSGQVLPVGDGVISLTDVKGEMRVKNSDWDFFRFDGIMTGANGVEGQQRLDFTIYGDIEANSQSVSLKNINTPFGGMAITYDFKNGRMTGHLNIDKNIGGIGMKGTANLLVDKDGYYILTGGQATPPGIGLIQAGMIFGSYPTLEGDIKSTLMQYSYDQNIPPTFAAGIKGFFITGTKTFPIDIPDIDVDLGVVSVAFGADVGADARVWMNFAGPGTSFGIGAMVFAHAYFKCQSMVCTSFGADARAEMGMQGDYNTSSGAFSLKGCGSISISAYGEQCVGALGACIDPCVDLGFTKSIKVDLLLNSKGDASIDLGLGNCSGQPPLTGGW